MRHVVVMPLVSGLLGEIGLSRDSLLAVLNRLYEQLGSNYDLHRGRRDPEDPDLFDYVLYLADESGNWYTMRFSVDDRQATDYLFVVALSYRVGKLRL